MRIGVKRVLTVANAVQSEPATIEHSASSPATVADAETEPRPEILA